MVRIALSLLKYHEYGNPFLVRTGPTAHEMPLYPLFLSLLYLIFGFGSLAEGVKIALACVLTALRCALMPGFCLDVGLGRNVAITAGVLASIYISALQTEVRGNWDGPWQALVILILTWMATRVWRDRSRFTRMPWQYSILWGFAILLQPAFLPILMVFLLAGLIVSPNGERRRYLKNCIAVLLTVVAFLLPWAIRNDLQFGKLIWTRSNFGLEFWVSNGPGRAFDMPTNLGFSVPHPSLDLHEAQLVCQLGEVRYNQAKLRETEAWVRTHPIQFTHLTVLRFLAWWVPPGRSVLHRVFSLGLSLLAFIGLGLMFRIQRLLAVLFSLTWASFPLVYYVIQWSSKYRYPMEWQLVISAGLAISSASEIAVRLFAQSQRTHPFRTHPDPPDRLPLDC
ncbi:MAG TPA: hypothetical protein VNX87_26845 [Candidatus Sulfotelmatobacter sp.]|nr:hypothetical protein [Candidatus Sulfotelmatobacter sp.]